MGAKIRPFLRRVLAGVVIVIGSLVTIASVTPLTDRTLRFLSDGSFLWWVPYLALVVWATVGALRPVALNWRLGWVAVGLGVLVFLNGLTPYLEIKTAYGWNMYSNLVTVDGESNHFLVRSTWPLREGHEDLVTVITSDDPGLQAYADEGYLLPWPSFISYTSAHPDVAVTYQRGEAVVEAVRAGDDPLLSGPVPWWWRWMPLRSINAATPDQCQPGFLPAL